MEFLTQRQFKKLNSIKPDKNWVVSNKERLLKGEHYYLNEPSTWDVFGILKRSWVLSSVVVLLIGATGFFAFMSYNNKMFINELLSKLNLTNSERQNKVMASLEEMRGGLKTIASSLEDLKTVKNKKEALVMASVVRATAKNGKETVKRLRETEQTAGSKVLASLDETEKQFQDMEQAVANVQTEFVSSLIKEYEAKLLTQKDKDLLNKAKGEFTAGRIEEAAMYISWIGQ